MYKYLKVNKGMSTSEHGFVKKKVWQVLLIYSFKIVISPVWRWEKDLIHTASTSIVVLQKLFHDSSVSKVEEKSLDEINIRDLQS